MVSDLAKTGTTVGFSVGFLLRSADPEPGLDRQGTALQATRLSRVGHGGRGGGSGSQMCAVGGGTDTVPYMVDIAPPIEWPKHVNVHRQRQLDAIVAGAVATAEESVRVAAPVAERVLIAGDAHGDSNWIEEICDVAVKQRCDVILQLGDFGFWSHTGAGETYLNNVDRALAERELQLWWIDGNHESFDVLRKLPVDDDGLVTVRDRIVHIPRGARWMWQGCRFGALGGAFSIDYERRVPGLSWWPGQEEVGQEDVDRLGDDQLDVLVTHDSPMGATVRSQFSVPAHIETRSQETRMLVAEAVRRCRPQLVLHGHWHQRVSSDVAFPEKNENGELDWWGARVEGFAANIQRDRDSWGVLLPGETPELETQQ